MAEISSENTVRVTLSATPRGLREANIASLVIFSNEVANKSGEYFAPMSPKEVADLYGVDSKTYAMALAVLGQTPNIRTARGSLYIVPYVAKDATHGAFVTADIAENVKNFAKVTNGSLKITVNGKAKEVKNLNFTGCDTIESIAEVLDNANLDAFVTVEDSTKIAFTSKLVGTGSTIAISTSSGGTDISGSTFLNSTTGKTTAGVNATATETLSEAINRIEEKLDFGGILTTQALENDALLLVSATVQATDHLFFVATNSLDNIEVLGQEISGANFNKTRLVAYSDKEVDSVIAGYASKALSPNFKANDTANTMNLKTIDGVMGDKYLTQEYYGLAKKHGVDIYGYTGGLSCIYSFDNGKYTDEAVGDLWLKKQIEVQAFNVLKQTNTKIAQTETGMIALKQAVERVCLMGVNNGLIGVGLRWNGADRFGNPEDFDRNIKERGFYIYSLPIDAQDQTEREARIAPVVQTAIKRAGAFHEADFIVILER